MSLTVGVDPAVAPGAIKELRAAMDELWKAFMASVRAPSSRAASSGWKSWPRSIARLETSVWCPLRRHLGSPLGLGLS